MTYVIIGGGIAGTTCAEELRKAEPDAEIILISEEFHPLYSRVLLPHYIKAKVPRERVFLKKESWYEEQRIEWLPGEMVTHVDASNKFVTLLSGRELSYDKLLIASGGEVTHAADDLKGVSYFRTLDDADHMLELLRGLPAQAPVAIYGGGFIACEYLNIFAHFNHPTTILLRGNHLWSRQLCAEAGEVIRQHLIQQGVNVETNVSSIELVGEQELSGVRLGDRLIECSMLGVGIGIQSTYGFLRDTSVVCEQGIETDAFLQTADESIFSAGDVTAFFDERLGRTLMTGNWMSAQTQGRLVAKNMRGERTAFDLVSSYATNALGLEIIFIGDTSRADADETHVVGSVEDKGVTEVFIRNGAVVGAILVGRNTDRMELTKMIRERLGWDVNLLKT